MGNFIGSQIRQRRKSLKITQGQLAELAGVSLNTLSRIESGKANPTIDVIEKIAEILGLKLELKIKQ